MTNDITLLEAWWPTEHDHSRCYWDWEAGRWICRPTDTTAAGAPASATELQEQR